MTRTSSRRSVERTSTLLRIALGLAVAILAAGGLYAWRTASPGAAGAKPDIGHVHGLAVDPADPARLWVATHHGLWAWREPGGWEGPIRPAIDLMGFSVTSEPGVLYASGHPGPGVRMPNPVGLIQTRDGGRTWEAVSLAGEVDFHAMAVSPADGRRVYAFFYGDGLFYRSDDGGRTWTRAQVAALAGPHGRGPLQLVAHPTDPETLLAAGESGLLRSHDGGRTWDAVLPGEVTAAAFVPGAPEQILAYVVDAGLVRSADGGRTWQPLGLKLGDKLGEGDAVGFLTVHPGDPDTVYAATFRATLLRSRDGGRTWQPLEPDR